MHHFVLFVWGNTEPEIHGEYKDRETRDAFAKELYRDEGPEHGIFALDIGDDGVPVVWSYPEGYLDGEN